MQAEMYPPDEDVLADIMGSLKNARRIPGVLYRGLI